MTAAELAAATRAYDADFAFLKARPLTRAERKLHAQARRRARPRPNPKSRSGRKLKADR